MLRTIGFSVLVISGALAVVGARSRSESPRAGASSTDGVSPTDGASPAGLSTAAGDRLIVHEWGTFTNFSGGDGVQLEFTPFVGKELPSFVYERAWHSSSLLTKARLVARQRMETPVAYFYSDRPRELDVRVDFPRGLLTEFYPPVAEMSPRENSETAPLKDSSLRWHVRLQPPAERRQAGDLPALPRVTGDDHYGFARQTDAAVVRTVDRAGVEHAEKFLFYRGVGNFTLPLRLEALSGRRFRIVNDGAEAIESLFMVMIDGAGLRFSQQAGIAAHATLDVTVPDRTATSDELGRRMAQALIGAGLYAKEAQAMIRTWQASWFSEPGARLFYLVPRPLTDGIIPLHIDPRPDEVVRVLVGRMETLTPEAVANLSAAIDGLADGESAAERLQAELNRLGRFAEPALGYLAEHESDAEKKAAISHHRRRLRAFATFGQ